MSKPLVTIIIPTFNRIWGLKNALMSVFEQDFKNWVVLVMDDCPDNPAREFVSSIKDARIKYYCQPKNKGVAGNWLDGVKKVKTKYFSLLMDDDWYDKNFLSARLSILENDCEVGIVYGPYFRIQNSNSCFQSNSDTITQICPNGYGKFGNDDLIKKMITRDAFIGCSVFRKRDINIVCSMSETYDIIIDYPFLIYYSLLTKCSCYVLSAPNFFYRNHDETLSNTKKDMVWSLCYKFMKKLSKDYPNFSPTIKTEAFNQCLVSSRQAGKYVAKIMWSLRAITFRPFSRLGYYSLIKSIFKIN